MDKRNFEPLLYAGLLATGLFIGSKFGNNPKQQHAGKIGEAIEIIASQYVDSVNQQALSNQALQGLLNQLDPHSVFIEPQQIGRYNAPLDGNFEGIGIEYTLVNDTVFVMRVFANGPAHKAGIKVADRLLKADSTSLIGKDNDQIAALIKGPAASKVNLLTQRGRATPFITTIQRGSIEIPSIPIAYMIKKEVGYIKLNQFSATTTAEFLKAVKKLNQLGMKSLVFDLRDNTGGYLQAAIDLLDAFFDDKKLLSYTADRNNKRKSYYSKPGGLCTKTKLVVLVNGHSASASELFSGAIQDHKRGKIIGTKTFGKGLVQESFGLSDGSVIRLTVARYYTPSGKCIQKAYKGMVTHDLDPEEGGITPDIGLTADTILEKYGHDLSQQDFTERELLIDIMQKFGSELNSYTRAEQFINNKKLSAFIAQKIEVQNVAFKHKLTQRIADVLIRDYLGEQAFYEWKNQGDEAIGLALKNIN